MASDNSEKISVRAYAYSDDTLHYRLYSQHKQNGPWWPAATGTVQPANGTADFTIQVDKSKLPGSTGQMWRLFISDGFNTAWYESSSSVQYTEQGSHGLDAVGL